MGREALAYAEVDDKRGEVRALLESSELILRGAIRRRFLKRDLESVVAQGELLCFTCVGEVVRLNLGSRTAEAWSKAIAAPPPTLRAKLGLGKGARALLWGSFDDSQLSEALDGMLVEDGVAAAMLIACIRAPEDLLAARSVHKAYGGLPLWTIYLKGAGVPFGEGDIRVMLRAEGLCDTKSCAVSDMLTATRYSLKRASLERLAV